MTSHPRRRGRILLIGNDADLRVSMSKALSGGGYVPMVASDTRSGLALLSDACVRMQPPAAIVIDGLIAGGVDAAIRGIHERAPRTPIVLASEVDPSKPKPSGATATIEKRRVGAGLVPLLNALLDSKGSSPPAAAAPETQEQPLVVREINLPPNDSREDSMPSLPITRDPRGGQPVPSSAPPPPSFSSSSPPSQPLRPHVVPPTPLPPGASAAQLFSREALTSRPGAQPAPKPIATNRKSRPRMPRPAFDDRDSPEFESLDATLRRHLEDLKEQDYFAVLQLKPSAGTEDIRKAFLTQAKRWHPSRFGLDSPAVRAVVTDIFLVVKKAHDALIDPNRRAAYAAQLAEDLANQVPRRKRKSPARR